MANGPSIWTRFFDWAPVRAARVFLGHIGLALVCVAGIWVVEWAIGRGNDPKFFDHWIPVKWFFDAGEAGMLATFVISGIYEALRELVRR
jgi:hypothetical protein